MARAAARPRAYHHGNLRQALVQAALRLAEQKGPEGVSVREAARALGVSPAAPFRHFPNRRALMTAVAEEAAERLRIEVGKATGRGGSGGGLARLRAIGRGYLQWALRYPAHFRIVSARDQIDLAGSPGLRAGIDEVRQQTLDALRAAQAQGQLRPEPSVDALALLARACAYGLARMQLDGHLPQWGVAPGQEEAAMDATLTLLIDLMAGPPEAKG
jgi:AcrR family transcriptional regulator